MAATPAGAAEDKARPRVSVVIPTGHEVDLLDRCVDALLGQTLPGREFEILVVDNGGSHHTQQFVAMWSARALSRGLVVRYLVNCSGHGDAASRNLGVRSALAPVIAFTSEQAVPSPTWLAQGMEQIAGGADVVCGRVEAPVPKRPTDYQRDAARLETAEFACANCFIRKALFDAVGGFDESFAQASYEDNDLHFRLLDIGATFVRAPHAMVIYPVQPAPWGISLLQLNKLVFDALLYKKHPQRYRQTIQAAINWRDYAIVAALLVLIGAMLAGVTVLAWIASAAWLVLTAMLCARRLHGTSRRFSHVIEVIVTSTLLPPVTVFWRLAGAIRYRVRLA